MGGFSYQKKDRLLKRHEFLKVSGSGQKLFNRHFIVILSPSQKDHSRLGITVSKKVGTASVRNKIKRLSREYFRLNQHKIEGNWDINLIAKNMAADEPPQKILFSLKDIFDRIAKDLKY